jgi:hypothetical protein
VFAGHRLSFESTTLRTSERNTIFDGHMGIDRLVQLTVKDLLSPITFSVQERFQSPKYAWREDLTVTEWNHASNRPGELHKLFADLFLAGCYDSDGDRLLNAIVVPCIRLKLAIAESDLPYRRVVTPKQQSFLSFAFDDLENAGLSLLRLPAARGTSKSSVMEIRVPC